MWSMSAYEIRHPAFQPHPSPPPFFFFLLMPSAHAREFFALDNPRNAVPIYEDEKIDDADRGTTAAAVRLASCFSVVVWVVCEFCTVVCIFIWQWGLFIKMATDWEVSEVGDTCRPAAGPGRGRSVEIEWILQELRISGFPRFGVSPTCFRAK